MALVFQFKTIFQRNENRFISLVLKAKQQNAVQLPLVCLKFVMNQFLLYLYFPDFRTLHESSLSLLPYIN